MSRDNLKEEIQDHIRILEKLEELTRIVEKRLAECHSHHGHMLKVRIEDCEHPDCKEMREALE